MSPYARTTALALALGVFAPARALAQRDGGPAGDANTAGDASRAAPADPGACTPDLLPLDRMPAVTATVEPAQPRVGDRVLVRYRFRYRAQDRLEFDPDVVAYQQPAIEMDYAREQPERLRGGRPDGEGWLVSEVVVAVQPFRSAEVVLRAQASRLLTGDEIARVCTPEVRFRVRGPFGNDPHPAPRDITEPELVRFGALTWRYIALGLDGAFVVVCGTLLGVALVRARPKKPVPPPPPRHPYDVAREALDALARSNLLSRGLTKDYYDAISDVVRRYLGGMCGFDAIEMTTREVITEVRSRPLPGVALVEVERLLSECDLVKFARYAPSHEENDEILRSAESIIDRGRPAVVPPRGEHATRREEPR
ncbi:MAG: hypothetical protein HY909_21750 [Deltaproteobacteria bacterium]|nr:hypothetical protein [Deltaproteobacteria bacterium]